MKYKGLWTIFVLFYYPLYGIASEPDSVVNTSSEYSESEDHGHHVAATAPISAVNDSVRVAFALTSTNGETRTEEDYLGQYVLLSFGFTHCEYVCPTIAAKMVQALKLTKEDAVGLFISVDTERDTPSVTDMYAKKFGSNMEGLGGTYTQISEAADNFGVTYAVTKSQNTYTVQHSATIYLIDPDGELVDVYALNASPEDMAAAMK